MCGGVKYRHDGQPYTVYFPKPDACLPVRQHSGECVLVPWGRRREQPGQTPQGGWARLDSVRAGKWQRYAPRPVLIEVDSFMEKDARGQSHWYPVEKGTYIQGLLARSGAGNLVYVVTIPPEAQAQAAVHDRWPRLVRPAEHGEDEVELVPGN